MGRKKKDEILDSSYKDKLNKLEKKIPGISESNDPENLVKDRYVNEELIRLVEKEFKKFKFKKNDHTNSIYQAIYGQMSRKKNVILEETEKLRDVYISEAIITNFINDAITPPEGEDCIFNYKSKDKKIQSELDSFKNDFSLDSFIMDISDEVVRYGEYYIQPIAGSGKEGIVDLLDNVEQSQIVTLSKCGKTEGFLIKDSETKLNFSGPNDFIRFTINQTSVRVDLASSFGLNRSVTQALNSTLNKELGYIPNTVKYGRSLIYPVINKIKELILLEALVPASKLSKLSQGNVIGVQMPSKATPSDGFDAASEIENLINDKVDIDVENGEVTVTNIISSAGLYKVIPIFGDKGRIEKLDYKTDEPEDLISSVQDLRKTICDSIGIPFELLYGSESSNKGEILKRYSRYLRLLRNFQFSLAKSLKQLALLHLVNKGIDVKEDDVSIEFTNKLISLDNLDVQEYTQVSIQILSDIKDFILSLNELVETNKEYINVDQFAKYIDKQLLPLGLGGILKVNKVKKEQQKFDNKEDGEGEGEDSEENKE